MRNLADMPRRSVPEEIPSREALDILGFTNHSTITRYVAEGKLTPTRRLPGKRGAYLFDRAEVVKLARKRAAELAAAAQAITAAAEAS